MCAKLYVCKVIGTLQSGGADISVQSYRENIGIVSRGAGKHVQSYTENTGTLQGSADICVQSYRESIGIRADNRGLHALQNIEFLQCSEEHNIYAFYSA